MSEEIENNTIIFLWRNNKNISSIVFDHVTYTATIITLVDKSVRVLNLNTSDNNSLDSISDNNNQHNGTGSNVNNISEVSEHNNNNEPLAANSLPTDVPSPVAAATTDPNDNNEYSENNDKHNEPLAVNSLPTDIPSAAVASPVAAATTDYNDNNEYSENNDKHNEPLAVNSLPTDVPSAADTSPVAATPTIPIATTKVGLGTRKNVKKRKASNNKYRSLKRKCKSIINETSVPESTIENNVSSSQSNNESIGNVSLPLEFPNNETIKN
ncbi:6831_t:CDS:2, partial [Dentiscutata heterogama]